MVQPGGARIATYTNRIVTASALRDVALGLLRRVPGLRGAVLVPEPAPDEAAAGLVDRRREREPREARRADAQSSETPFYSLRMYCTLTPLCTLNTQTPLSSQYVLLGCTAKTHFLEGLPSCRNTDVAEWCHADAGLDRT